MSRIGAMPIILPQNVTVVSDSGFVNITGPKGALSVVIPEGIKVMVNSNVVTVENHLNQIKGKALHGLVRAHIANAVVGVTQGFTKTLELVGVGYRALLNGSDLTLSVGFSHPVIIKSRPGIQFSVNEGKIVVSGIDKQLVGQIAANIRAVKKPEPYKGKGIRYQGEHVRKKAGKAKSVGGTGSK
jgi:large subunit ribosomal protein L6